MSNARPDREVRAERQDPEGCNELPENQPNGEHEYAFRAGQQADRSAETGGLRPCSCVTNEKRSGRCGENQQGTGETVVRPEQIVETPA